MSAHNEHTKVDYRAITASSFRRYREVLTRYLTNKYNLTVIERGVVDSEEFIGSFNGKNIIVKSGLGDEHKLFLLAHLFGHCVQWCGADSTNYADVDQSLPVNNGGGLSEEKLEALRAYEAEAAGYAVQLLNDSLSIDLSQWFSDWSHADWDYFVNISSFEDKPEVPTLDVKFGTDLIPPKEIAEITLREINTKYAY